MKQVWQPQKTTGIVVDEATKPQQSHKAEIGIPEILPSIPTAESRMALLDYKLMQNELEITIPPIIRGSTSSGCPD
ncbi:hypothetical protein HAX54_031521 [Datura stramonium]|uniref:Uncharacterized protein n=1 Tax=Datura stramonium TaxID=4076 RepID=A0ABS8RH48_DATST|nr:hypothetical protein [Datura stramonium]